MSIDMRCKGCGAEVSYSGDEDTALDLLRRFQAEHDGHVPAVAR